MLLTWAGLSYVALRNFENLGNHMAGGLDFIAMGVSVLALLALSLSRWRS